MVGRSAAVLVFALACIACGGRTEAHRKELEDRVVPRVVGMKTETAVATLTGHGFCLGTLAWGAYTRKAAGRVLAQQPPPGRRIPRLGVVSITVAPMGPSGEIVSTPTYAGCDPARIVFPTPG